MAEQSAGSLNRRDFLEYAGLAGTSLVLSGCAGGHFSLSKVSDRPNILVIVIDDMGWADVGYHSPEIKSPNLDKLARTGVELDCHYVQPQCTPTRVALMTGRFPSRFGRHCTQASNEQAYPIGTLTMASMLKSLGYETAITGKWHMGSKPEWGPNHHGFDYSYGSLAGVVGMYDHRYRLNSPYRTTWHRNHKYIEEEGHVTDLTAAEAVKWVEQKRNRPFFLYAAFNAVHTPLVEEGKWLEMNEHIEHEDRRLFAAAVTHLDDAIGRIVKAVERTGQRDNTLIIVTSDNGGIAGKYKGGYYPEPDPALENFSSNEPLRAGKSTVYEGGIRVPAFVNWPGHLKPGKVTAPVHIVDWMPTLAKMLGYKAPEEQQWDGQDIWPVVTAGLSEQQNRQFYWVWGRERNCVALRYGDWKILRNEPNGAWELYNLADDPYEKNDLAEKQPGRMAELMGRFRNEAAKDAKQL
jgi:arylsulfatase A-like enzyme